MLVGNRGEIKRSFFWHVQRPILCSVQNVITFYLTCIYSLLCNSLIFTLKSPQCLLALFAFGNMFNFNLNLDTCVICFAIVSLRIIH